MKRTRKELIIFLREILKDDINPQGCSYIADKLIQEGWCKVDEPKKLREFWIVTNVVNSEKVVWDQKPNIIFGGDKEVIHVREVIEDNKVSQGEIHLD